MQQTWRWFGPQDPVSLMDIRQAGASGVVTALHGVPNGEIWTADAIGKRKAMIEDAGLEWSVVESIPLHEDIKLQRGNWRAHVESWITSMRNLASHDISNICYNFMPVLDWTRTDLAYELPNGAKCLRFDHTHYAAFDLFILKREGAEADYDDKDILLARQAFEAMSDDQRNTLIQNMIAGLPGSEESYDLAAFADQLSLYRSIDADQLRRNLGDFLELVLPAAEEAGVVLSIHPDDPPRPLFGLPRIVSCIEDMRAIRAMAPSPSNGFTLCSGSYGVNETNDLVSMISEFGDHIHFLHLRSTKRDGQSFHEADHFGGDIDMVEVLKTAGELEARTGRSIPFRPDHGHQILDDLKRHSNPGYPAIGRLKGLAELRGALLALGATVN